ncbi:MAG TPA: hypothetical protein VIM86_10505 [Thermodesulfobacteriota bacterium]
MLEARDIPWALGLGALLSLLVWIGFRLGVESRRRDAAHIALWTLYFLGVVVLGTIGPFYVADLARIDRLSRREQFFWVVLAIWVFASGAFMVRALVRQVRAAKEDDTARRSGR